jgi:signal transduction histidine kinase
VALSLRARETLALTTVVLLVVAVATGAHLLSLGQVTLRAAADEGRLLARQLYHQAAHSLAADPSHPDQWRQDPAIQALAEGMVGYSRTVVYAVVADPAGVVVVSSDPALHGVTLRPRPLVEDVQARGALAMLGALLDAPQVFEAQLPLRLREQPFGTVRVGISTTLVRQELYASLRRSVLLGLVATALAVAVGLGAGRALLQLGHRLVSRVGRLARGERYGGSVELNRQDTMGSLAAEVDRLGEALQAGARTPAAGRDPVIVASLVTYAQKLAALGRLMSGVAHEVKNPLNAMRIHVELLRVRLPGATPEVAGSLQTIAAEITRLDRVVQGFLRFVRPQDLAVEPVDLNALLAEVARLAGPEATRAGVDVALEPDPQLPRVTGDAGLLQQACTNLVLNAIQAMEKGGRLVLGSRRAGSTAVALSFRDQGVGIPPDDLDRIFRLYYSTKEGGSGLGLPIVYRTVQLHDGRIDVASVVGEGTTFTVTLPLAPGMPLP